MNYRKIKLTHYSHKAVRQGELAYVESKDKLVGGWCQKLPVEDDIYYVPFCNSIPSITRKDLENWDKNYTMISRIDFRSFIKMAIMRCIEL